MPAETRTPALRTRLLVAVLGPLLAAAILIGVVGATLIADVVRRTNDRVLGGALGAIAETVQVERGEVTLDLPSAAFGMLENTERDNVYYRVAVGPDLLTGYADLPAPDPATLSIDVPRYRFARYRGQQIRIAEVRRSLPRIDKPVIVQIAETLDNRGALTRRLMLALLIGECVLVGAAALLIRPALGWSLRPLARLRGAVEARDGRARPDFSPLDTGPLPSELRPLAGAFDRLLAQLDTATVGVRRFTADASHQMRTPLSVLKVQVALARRGSGPERSVALDEIADAVVRLERLVTQLLALARAEEAGVSAPLEAVDLREVAVAVITRQINRAIEAGIDLTIEGDPEVSHVVPGHRTLIFEIVSNLIDNGIRYNRRGGTVSVRLQTTPSETTIAVVDDGPGIPHDQREMAFDRFVRLGAPGSPEGSGLGLAIVRSAATRLNATVAFGEVASGTSVILRFFHANE
ncbi:MULTISPECIES: sensor histidine kinase [unclassified Sphingomonas]|uniref:sensor histidine kinase n=1 Tax=unclassified Sphingomonas TaxID=196159 RepID=UPI000E72D40A|nr:MULTISPECIES: sensor histidine kinase [unclassified Sphingomonas]RKE47655.1 two-component system sensor histidine kinase TctE [Sphingomonas sp. PP-CC-1A-547]TCM07149.1 two-component system sensor histidine kinase TctE [Sphingomonas sp. PP-CC-3G-468]